MSGKKKNKNVSASTDPPALPGPTYAPIPQPQPQPGHLELLAQQLNQGYPSMSSADTLKHLQGVYKPPAPGPDPATAAVVAQSASGTGMANHGASGGNQSTGTGLAARDTGWRGGMLNDYGDFMTMMELARQRQQGG